MDLEQLIVKDKDFLKSMDEVIHPFIKDKFCQGHFTTPDGLKINYEYGLNPDAKGNIVISHGYCEFITKYYEIMYYLYNMGYSVFMVDHRGHGLSDRQVDGYSMVYVKNFNDYVKDFNQFINEVVLPNSSGKELILYAHSMGGAVGIRYLETYPDVFKRAVLNSPMIAMNLDNTPAAAIKAVTIGSLLPGVGKKYTPGQIEYNGEYKYPKCSTISEERYKYQYAEREREPHYQSNGASMSWSREAFNISKKILKNAPKVQIPVILCQAGRDTLVALEPQNEFVRLCQSVKLVRFEESKHEIFNATDEIIMEYWKTIYEFLG